MCVEWGVLLSAVRGQGCSLQTHKPQHRLDSATRPPAGHRGKRAETLAVSQTPHRRTENTMPLGPKYVRKFLFLFF